MVILVDDEDRENEGDLVHGRRARHGRGDQLHGDPRARAHLPRAHEEQVEQLELPMMSAPGRHGPPLGTAFTVSIEARTA
jgi:3,4-dihydroxy 2-butanone 4-phosphate synthase/GTP cyclohydrolase II